MRGSRGSAAGVADVADVRVDQNDVQGNVLAGDGFRHGLFVTLRVTDPAAGRAWLAEAMDGGAITSAMPFGRDKPATTLNIAFTHDGLRSLGVSDEALRSF